MPAMPRLWTSAGRGRRRRGPPKAIGKDERERLARAVEALPVTLREVLILREYHGLSYREIAEVGGIPLGTVMSRLARARQHLLARVQTSSR